MKITVFKKDASERNAMTPTLKEKIIGLAFASGLTKENGFVSYYNPFVELIKEFRAFSGAGLKEAKDAVENCQDAPCDANGRTLWTKEQRQAFVSNIVRLFNDNSSNPLDERKEFPEQFILEGVRCSLENWKKLGYDAPIDSVKDFISRYENKP